MSNILVEGFATYGIGPATGGSPVATAMLSGAWASYGEVGSGSVNKITTLPWDTSGDLYLAGRLGDSYTGTFFNKGWRRVLPDTLTEAIFSFYHATDILPSNFARIFRLTNVSNQDIVWLDLLSTGALRLYANGTLGATAGPVVVAEQAVHMEFKINTDDGDFELRVGGETVLSLQGQVFANSGGVAQFYVLEPGNTTVSEDTQNCQYIGHLIVRDTNGSTNNDFMGDRKVATLFPNRDVVGVQGWTPRPLKRFGNGVLDLTGGKWVSGPAGTATDIGSNEFTIEGQFRFKTLPQGSDKAVLFGKWDENANQRSYQLYLGGPDLDNGLLTFRTSTDGQNGTVVNKLQWKWEPVTGRWYHIALVRSNGELLLFIDGIQQGIPIADTDTYYAGANALPCLGAQANGTSEIAGTLFDGWQDEFRLTIGTARYTANFSPPTDAFDRGAGDPDWGAVAWLSSWDNSAIADDGPLGLLLASRDGATTITPNDGGAAFETVDQRTPTDDTFIEAELIAAQAIFTLTDLPTASETVTVGTTDGVTPAVYTFVATLSSAFDVLIGANIVETMANLAAAINGGDGEGSVYGTGTTANNDVSAEVQPTGQLVVTALTPGQAGNSISVSDTCSDGSWDDTTLTGGQDIPGPTQFQFERMPPNTTVVDSVTLVARQWRSDVGAASTKVSFVGGSNGVLDGEERVLGSTPSLSFDTFEADPDSSGPLSPTSILLGKFQIDRTA